MTENITGKYGQLRVLNSDQKTHPLKPGRFSIGDGDALEAKIRVYGNDIQPIHCIVQVDENRLATLIATSNFHTTTLNNNLVRKEKVQFLKPGDVIELGGVRIVYENSTLTKEEITAYSNIVKPLQLFRTPLRRNSSTTKSFKARVASPRSAPRFIGERPIKWTTDILTTTLFPSHNNSINLVEPTDKPDANNSTETPTKQQKITGFKTPRAFGKSSTDNEDAELAQRWNNTQTIDLVTPIKTTPRLSASKSFNLPSVKTPGSSSKLKHTSFVDLITPSTEFSSSRSKILEVRTPGLSTPKSPKSILKRSRSMSAEESSKKISYFNDVVLDKSASCGAKKGKSNKSLQGINQPSTPVRFSSELDPKDDIGVPVDRSAIEELNLNSSHVSSVASSSFEYFTSPPTDNRQTMSIFQKNLSSRKGSTHSDLIQFTSGSEKNSPNVSGVRELKNTPSQPVLRRSIRSSSKSIRRNSVEVSPTQNKSLSKADTDSNDTGDNISEPEDAVGYKTLNESYRLYRNRSEVSTTTSSSSSLKSNLNDVNENKGDNSTSKNLRSSKRFSDLNKSMQSDKNRIFNISGVSQLSSTESSDTMPLRITQNSKSPKKSLRTSTLQNQSAIDKSDSRIDDVEDTMADTTNKFSESLKMNLSSTPATARNSRSAGKYTRSSLQVSATQNQSAVFEDSDLSEREVAFDSEPENAVADKTDKFSETLKNKINLSSTPARSTIARSSKSARKSSLQVSASRNQSAVAEARDLSEGEGTVDSEPEDTVADKTDTFAESFGNKINLSSTLAQSTIARSSKSARKSARRSSLQVSASRNQSTLADARDLSEGEDTVDSEPENATADKTNKFFESFGNKINLLSTPAQSTSARSSRSARKSAKRSSLQVSASRNQSAVTENGDLSEEESIVDSEPENTTADKTNKFSESFEKRINLSSTPAQSTIARSSRSARKSARRSSLQVSASRNQSAVAADRDLSEGEDTVDSEPENATADKTDTFAESFGNKINLSSTPAQSTSARSSRSARKSAKRSSLQVSASRNQSAVTENGDLSEEESIVDSEPENTTADKTNKFSESFEKRINLSSTPAQSTIARSSKSARKSARRSSLQVSASRNQSAVAADRDLSEGEDTVDSEPENATADKTDTFAESFGNKINLSSTPAQSASARSSRSARKSAKRSSLQVSASRNQSAVAEDRDLSEGEGAVDSEPEDATANKTLDKFSESFGKRIYLSSTPAQSTIARSSRSARKSAKRSSLQVSGSRNQSTVTEDGNLSEEESTVDSDPEDATANKTDKFSESLRNKINLSSTPAHSTTVRNSRSARRSSLQVSAPRNQSAVVEARDLSEGEDTVDSEPDDAISDKTDKFSESLKNTLNLSSTLARSTIARSSTSARKSAKRSSLQVSASRNQSAVAEDRDLSEAEVIVDKEPENVTANKTDKFSESLRNKSNLSSTPAQSTTARSSRSARKSARRSSLQVSGCRNQSAVAEDRDLSEGEYAVDSEPEDATANKADKFSESLRNKMNLSSTPARSTTVVNSRSARKSSLQVSASRNQSAVAKNRDLSEMEGTVDSEPEDATVNKTLDKFSESLKNKINLSSTPARNSRSARRSSLQVSASRNQSAVDEARDLSDGEDTIDSEPDASIADKTNKFSESLKNKSNLSRTSASSLQVSTPKNQSAAAKDNDLSKGEYTTDSEPDDTITDTTLDQTSKLLKNKFGLSNISAKSIQALNSLNSKKSLEASSLQVSALSQSAILDSESSGTEDLFHNTEKSLSQSSMSLRSKSGMSRTTTSSTLDSDIYEIGNASLSESFRSCRSPAVPKSPKNDLTDVSGVRRIMKTPKIQKSPKNSLDDVRGVKNLVKTPRPQNSPANDLTDVGGVKKLMKTPKLQRAPKNDLTDVGGVKKLMKTPKIQHSPKNDLTNVKGVKKLMETPKVQRPPVNDLTDVRGVKRLMATPKVQRSPKNTLEDVSGISRLFRVARPSTNDITNISLTNLFGNTEETVDPKDIPEQNDANTFHADTSSEAFDRLTNRKSIRTYRGKSSSPAKLNRLGALRKSVSDAPTVSPSVAKWVETHSKYVEEDNDIGEMEQAEKAPSTSDDNRKSINDKMTNILKEVQNLTPIVQNKNNSKVNFATPRNIKENRTPTVEVRNIDKLVATPEIYVTPDSARKSQRSHRKPARLIDGFESDVSLAVKANARTYRKPSVKKRDRASTDTVETAEVLHDNQLKATPVSKRPNENTPKDDEQNIKRRRGLKKIDTDEQKEAGVEESKPKRGVKQVDAGLESSISKEGNEESDEVKEKPTRKRAGRKPANKKVKEDAEEDIKAVIEKIENTNYETKETAKELKEKSKTQVAEEANNENMKEKKTGRATRKRTAKKITDEAECDDKSSTVDEDEPAKKQRVTRKRVPKKSDNDVNNDENEEQSKSSKMNDQEQLVTKQRATRARGAKKSDNDADVDETVGQPKKDDQDQPIAKQRATRARGAKKSVNDVDGDETDGQSKEDDQDQPIANQKATRRRGATKSNIEAKVETQEEKELPKTTRKRALKKSESEEEVQKEDNKKEETQPTTRTRGRKKTVSDIEEVPEKNKDDARATRKREIKTENEMKASSKSPNEDQPATRKRGAKETKNENSLEIKQEKPLEQSSKEDNSNNQSGPSTLKRSAKRVNFKLSTESISEQKEFTDKDFVKPDEVTTRKRGRAKAVDKQVNVQAEEPPKRRGRQKKTDDIKTEQEEQSETDDDVSIQTKETAKEPPKKRGRKNKTNDIKTKQEDQSETDDDNNSTSTLRSTRRRVVKGVNYTETSSESGCSTKSERSTRQVKKEIEDAPVRKSARTRK